MSKRAAILNRLRVALREGGDDAARAKAVQQRLMTAPRGVIPARGQLPNRARVELFCTVATKFAASVQHVAQSLDVPEAVAGYLRERNLPARLRMGTDARLGAMPWNDSLEILSGCAETEDLVGVSHAMAAVAETGTVLLPSGGDNPTTVNFLPEHHIVVLNANDIAGDMETVFDWVRVKYGKGTLPRTLNFITGPSRSADIEQTLLLGAHGPRALHLIVIAGN